MHHVFISDIDGTLIKTSEGLNPVAIKAVNDFVDLGNDFLLATGRSLEATKDIAKKLKITLPCILYGGAMLYDFNKSKCVFSMLMDDEIYQAIYTILEFESNVSICVYTENKSYTLRNNNIILERGVFHDRTAPFIEIKDLNERLIKVLITSDDTYTLEKIGKQYINSKLFEYHSASEHFYEITAKHSNKGNAVAMLKEYIKDYDDVVFHIAGDACSDLMMKTHSDVFYAPYVSKIKEQADYIFSTASKGGIKEAIDFAKKYNDSKYN